MSHRRNAAFLIALGILSAFWTLQRLPQTAVIDTAYHVRIERDSIAFFGPNLTRAAFWLSPAEDHVAAGAQEKPLIARDRLDPRVDVLGQATLLAENALLARNVMAWYVRDRDRQPVDVIYVVSRLEGKAVRVVTTIDGLGKPEALTTGIRYCEGCSAWVDRATDPPLLRIGDAYGDLIAAVVLEPGEDVRPAAGDRVYEVRRPLSGTSPVAVSRDVRFSRP